MAARWKDLGADKIGLHGGFGGFGCIAMRNNQCIGCYAYTYTYMYMLLYTVNILLESFVSNMLRNTGYHPAVQGGVRGK